MHREGLFPSDGKPKADGYWYDGNSTGVTDTSVRHVLVPQFLGHQAASARAAAHRGEADKEAIYEAKCQEHGFDFVPAVFQSSGGMGRRMREHLSATAKAVADATACGDRDAAAIRREFVERWSVWFSVTLAKGYADRIANICFRNHIPLSFARDGSP